MPLIDIADLTSTLMNRTQIRQRNMTRRIHRQPEIDRSAGSRARGRALTAYNLATLNEQKT